MLSVWSRSEFGFSWVGIVIVLSHFCSTSWVYGKKILYLENSLNIEKMPFLCCSSKIRWKEMILEVTDTYLESSCALECWWDYGVGVATEL